MPYLIGLILGLGGYYLFDRLTKPSWKPLPGGTELQPGQVYRWSANVIQGATMNALDNTFLDFISWDPGNIPSDWPTTDMDPTRMRFQGRLDPSQPPTSFPASVPLWVWK